MNNTTQTTDRAELLFHIARLEEQAQNAEDREQLGRASKIRAQIRQLRSELAALVAVAS